MKAIKVKIGGHEHYLAFNGEAMFAIRDEYGGVEELLEKLKLDTRESFNITCDVVALMAEQGELARRYFGYEPQKLIGAETFKQIIQPPEIIALKLVIPRAIALGYGTEVDRGKDDEVDLGLAELNQKKTG